MINIEKVLCVDNTPRYYITHESANESLVLTKKEAEDLYNSLYLMLDKKPINIKPKLFIHETDCHGQGYAIYNGQVKYYAYDCESGDLKGAVEALIDIGFINPDDVVIIEGEEIYNYLKEK